MGLSSPCFAIEFKLSPACKYKIQHSNQPNFPLPARPAPRSDPLLPLCLRSRANILSSKDAASFPVDSQTIPRHAGICCSTAARSLWALCAGRGGCWRGLRISPFGRSGTKAAGREPRETGWSYLHGRFRHTPTHGAGTAKAGVQCTAGFCLIRLGCVSLHLPAYVCY